MRLSLSDSELQIRQEVRAFLAEHWAKPVEVPHDFDERTEFLREWQRKLHVAGLVGLTWPTEYGGRGATSMEQIVAYQEFARARAPEIIGEVGVGVVGPTIVAHGTDAQKAAYLDRILAGDDIWCQGFSEPDAGSDLASLKTRAVDAGSHFVLDGQKIWTSYVRHARWCAVLARTDPSAPPHKGISYLLVDLTSKGVDSRQLVQVTGDPEFGEVFFDGVVVPKENLLGELHGGWGMAMHTLAHERGPMAMTNQVNMRVRFDDLLDAAKRVNRGGVPAVDDGDVRANLVRAYVAIEVLRCQTYRSAGQSEARGAPGFESSVDKLVAARTEQQLADAALDVLGPYGPLDDGTAWGIDLHEWHHTYLYGRATSVFGGSAQIQRNIIAERILGLPRSS